MTQRFGGLFSILNRREIADLYRSTDFASNFLHFEGIEEPLESIPVSDLIQVAEEAKSEISDSVFGDEWEYREINTGFASHKEGLEGMGDNYFREIVTPARQHIRVLDKIIEKLKRVQYRYENEELR